ncbi:hypothetical protein B0H19DRAFT_895048, partial [Mycena capillaripes]
YLFLCPLAELQTEVPTCFRIPECAAYWSLDPSGVARLTAEEANIHGFPDFEFRMQVVGKSWESDVYTGIRRFYEAKNLDPHSQEIRIELGVPVFRV